MQYIKCNNVKQEESYIFFRFFQTENNSELQALNRKGCIYNKKHEQYLTIKTKISMYYMKKRFCTQQRKMRSSPGMLLNFFELFIINSIFFFFFPVWRPKMLKPYWVWTQSITHQSMLLSATLTL